MNVKPAPMPPTNTIEHKKLSDLTPDDANANKGTERGGYMIGRSVEKYGVGRSILLDKNLRIIAGNKTTEAAGAAGIDDIILVHTTGNQVVGVVRDDLDLDDTNARELAYADNRTAEVSLAWDAEQMARDLIAGVDVTDFWRQEEIDALVDGAMGDSDAMAGEEKTIELAGFQRTHILLSFPPSKLVDIESYLQSILTVQGVSMEQSST